MRPLFFVPISGQPTDSPETLFRKVGLPFPAVGIDSIRTQGPDGQTGILFAWLDPKNNQLRYSSKEQFWIPAVAQDGMTAGRYWVGMWSDSPPTERDLRRPDHRRGNLVRLGNNERWLITTPETLERYAVPQPDGTLQWVVDEQFNWLVTELEHRKAAGIVRKDTDGKEVLSVLWDDENDFWFLCRLLAVNYRITPELVGHLRLFSNSAIREITAALMGLVLLSNEEA